MTNLLKSLRRGASAWPYFVVALFAVNLWLRYGKSSRSQSGAAKVGEVAPDFSGRLLGGEDVSRDKLAGKNVVVAFFATWCGPCREELPVLSQVASETRDSAMVLGVNVEGRPISEQEMSAYLAKLGVSLPVMLDGDAMAGRYGVETIPFLAVLDREGKVVSLQSGGATADELRKLLAR